MRGARGGADTVRQIDRRKRKYRCDATARLDDPERPYPDKKCGAINQTSIREIEELWREKHAALEVDLAGHGSEIQSPPEDEVITRWPL